MSEYETGRSQEETARSGYRDEEPRREERAQFEDSGEVAFYIPRD